MVSAMAAVSICCIPQASGDDGSWTNPVGGLYGSGANWNTPAPPGAGDRAYFMLPGAPPAPTYTVGFDDNEESFTVRVLEYNDVTFDLNAHEYVIESDIQVGSWGDGFIGTDGFLTVTYGQLTTSGGLFVGDWDRGGSPSSLTIAGGGQVLAAWGEIYTTDVVTSVHGEDSSLTVSGFFRLGNGGVDGVALEITNEAAVSVRDGEFYGGIRVNGKGSTFSASGYVSIGYWEYGLLEVTGEGTATLQGAEITGTYTKIDGAGSSLTFTDWGGFEESELEITNGGQLIVDSELDLLDSMVRIDGTNSSLTCGDIVWIEEDTMLEITDGGHFTTGELLLGDGAGVRVGFNGTLEVSGDLSMSESGLLLESGSHCLIGGELKLMFGQLSMNNVAIAPELLQFFHSEIVGSGEVEASFGGDASSTVTASGNWVLGDANRYDGFNHAGRLSVGPYGVTLHSKGFAALGILTELDGGTLTAPNGIAIGIGENLVGHGTISGRVAAGFGSTIEATGNLAIGDASAFDGFVSDGVLVVADNTVTIHDANQAVLGSLTQLGTDAADGVLAADNGLVVEFGKNIVGRGTVDTPNNPLLPVTNNGSIIGDSPGAIELIGYVKGVGTLTNVIVSGTLSPGLSPVRLHATNLEIGDGGKLVMELGGLSGGSEYDQLDVVGNLTLGGTLQVSLIGGFAPSVGDTFEILFGELNDTEFDAFELPALAGRKAWDDSKLYSEGKISVIGMLDGDTDVDWDVDSVDLANLVSVVGGAGDWHTDFNEDGRVDLTDFALMRANFGAGVAPGAPGDAAAATPEPATLILMAAGLPLLLRRRRLRLTDRPSIAA